MNNQPIDFSPMDCWDKARDSHYHAGIFHAKPYRSCFSEQDGYADVLGRALRYWLYDTASTHGGDNGLLHSEVLPAWVESLGYVIDTANIREVYPNTALAQTVRELMRERGCNVSATLIRNAKGALLCYINEEISSGYYKTTVYPLRKKKRQARSSDVKEKELCTS